MGRGEEKVNEEWSGEGSNKIEESGGGMKWKRQRRNAVGGGGRRVQ